jgi:hypothetical protein
MHSHILACKRHKLNFSVHAPDKGAIQKQKILLRAHNPQGKIVRD